MEKYNKILLNIAEIIEKGLLNTQDVKKEITNAGCHSN